MLAVTACVTDYDRACDCSSDAAVPRGVCLAAMAVSRELPKLTAQPCGESWGSAPPWQAEGTPWLPQQSNVCGKNTHSHLQHAPHSTQDRSASAATSSSTLLPLFLLLHGRCCLTPWFKARVRRSTAPTLVSSHCSQQCKPCGAASNLLCCQRQGVCWVAACQHSSAAAEVCKRQQETVLQGCLCWR